MGYKIPVSLYQILSSEAPVVAADVWDALSHSG